MPTPRSNAGERLTRGLFYRRVSNAAANWDEGRPTHRAFDPQPGDKGISLFLQGLLDHDPDVARRMVLAGHPDHGLVSISAEQFLQSWAHWRLEIPELQPINLHYDPNDKQCGGGHCYLIEETETQRLQSYIKDILVEIAHPELYPPNGLRGGARQPRG